jgi:transposase
VENTIRGIKYASTDMWPAYLKDLRERVSGTTNILDRFRIMKKFPEVMDKVRADSERPKPTCCVRTSIDSGRTVLQHGHRSSCEIGAQGLSSGIVEEFNNKAKLTVITSYGFREVETISTALYHQLDHQLGDLPEPIRTHKFY